MRGARPDVRSPRAMVPPTAAAGPVGDERMDYVKPVEAVADAVDAACIKAGAAATGLLLKGAMAGALLGCAASLASATRAQGLPPIAGAMLFPIGFVLLVMLGLELVTGNFALCPMAVMAGRIRAQGMLRNWGWVYLGNLAGSVFYAALFVGVMTKFGTNDGGAMAEQVRELALKKTIAYADLGLPGWSSALASGILCNWMVTTGTVIVFVSRSVTGKIALIWLPILTFYALGYEHAVVNMYLIPAGMLFGAPISAAEWWIWNQIPVTVGNILGGSVLTGAALFAVFGRTEARGTGGAYGAAGTLLKAEPADDRRSRPRS